MASEDTERFCAFVAKKFPAPLSVKNYEDGIRYRWNFGVKIVDLVLVGDVYGQQVARLLFNKQWQWETKWEMSRPDDIGFNAKVQGKEILEALQSLLVFDYVHFDAKVARTLASKCPAVGEVISASLRLILDEIAKFARIGNAHALAVSLNHGPFQFTNAEDVEILRQRGFTCVSEKGNLTVSWV